MSSQIKIGSDIYNDSQIDDVTIHDALSLSFDTLEYSTATMTVDSGTITQAKSDEPTQGFAPPYYRTDRTFPYNYKYGTPVSISHDGKELGQYYVKKVRRTGKWKYRIECVSPIGLLASIRHYGNVYEDKTVADVLQDIIGQSIKYQIAPSAASLKVNGWLPIATKRDNLHQLMIAYGLAVTGYNAKWEPIFGYIDSESITGIPDNMIYTGGGIDYDDGVDSVAVTEHGYTTKIKGERVTLFEGEVEPTSVTTPNGVETIGRLVTFPEPMITPLIYSGGDRPLEQHPNYAVIPPAKNYKLEGYKVFHTTRQIVKSYNTQQEFLTENSASVSDATLVSSLNSESVVDRVYEYYSKAKTVSMGIIPQENYVGQSVQFRDPFDDLSTGIISSMDTMLSGVLKSDVEIVTNFTPYDSEKIYKNVDVVTTNQRYKVKPGVYKIRVMIIGAGSGGESGCTGGRPTSQIVDKAPTTPPGRYETAAWMQYNSVDGGEGGEPGKGGLGGRISIVTLAVSPGDEFDISIGVGGEGGKAVPGATEPTPGLAGGDTTFGKFTSADGVSSPLGIVPSLVGKVLGKTGDSGIKGGRGAFFALRYQPGVNAEPKPSPRRGLIRGPSGEVYECGKSPEIKKIDDLYHESQSNIAASYSGCGGGPAVGANGHDGTSDVFARIYHGQLQAHQAIGGNGADAAIPGISGKEIGEGGGGGHGGGGGGANGPTYAYYYGTPGQKPTFAVKPTEEGSVGGSGSDGGSGANGGVLIFS